MPPQPPDCPDSTFESTPHYTAAQLSEHANLSAARRDIERIAGQMKAQGVGATDYFGLMDLQPSMQRVFFIHVPKCGGTSIRKLLVHKNQCAPVPLPGSGPIDQATAYMAHAYLASNPRGELLQPYLAADNALDRRERFLHIYAGYLLTQNPEKMFILGHKQARELLPFYRADSDIFFTTVRAPAEILKSMVAYRVAHTLKNENRPDSRNLLKYLQMDIEAFTQAVKSQPQSLAQKILETDSPSLAAFLSFHPKPDHACVIKGLKDNRVFIAHMSEQSQMLSELFGKQTALLHENTSNNREGLAAEFTASVQADWATPFVDPESSQVYGTLESSGIIGYWENGGTRAGYLELLKNL